MLDCSIVGTQLRCRRDGWRGQEHRPRRGNGRLGAPLAYLTAALIPVGWVALDLLVITRQFNAITAVAGITALGSGVLAFWFVDGVLFALKDFLATA